MAAIYDGVILFGIVMFFGYGFSAVARFRAEDGLLRSTFQWYLFAVLGVYFIGFWSGGRRTLPMKTMSVVLVNDADGRPVSALRAAWRYVVASALFWGLLAFVWRHSPWLAVLWPLPFLWGAVDPRRRTWYDIAAGTRLVHRPPLPAAKPG